MAARIMVWECCGAPALNGTRRAGRKQARHPEVAQAYADLQRGLQDTDRGVPAHQAYQKQKKPG